MPIVSPRAPYRFTVAQVLRMVEAGLLAGARVELLDGELVRMTAKGPLHIFLVRALDHRFQAALGAGWHVRKEEPLETSPTSAPEPDLAIVRGAERDYKTRLPTGSECALAVEVSVSTLEDDRAKLPIYASGGISEVWILDVVGRRLERYAVPLHGAYARVDVLAEPEVVEVPVVGERWSVATLFD